MIWIGLTGWGDHYTLYESVRGRSDKLNVYSGYFPVVEVDSSFYAIQPERNMLKWVGETPDSFQFVVKAYQGMTGHQRGDIPFDSKEEMFKAFKKSLKPMEDAEKLSMVLLQFPPWFDCRKENVAYLKYCRKMLSDLPIALEFRNRSWFSEEYKTRTLQYMKDENWIHSICDEPQAGERSIPLVPEVTNESKTLFRLHGRNVHGWTKPVKGQEWRDVRYLYDYNDEELNYIAETIKRLDKDTEDIFVVFNNNSGGHAAANARKLIGKIGIKYQGLAPRQIDLFE